MNRGAFHVNHEHRVQALVPETVNRELGMSSDLARDQLVLSVLLITVPASAALGHVIVQTREPIPVEIVSENIAPGVTGSIDAFNVSQVPNLDHVRFETASVA